MCFVFGRPDNRKTSKYRPEFAVIAMEMSRPTDGQHVAVALLKQRLPVSSSVHDERAVARLDVPQSAVAPFGAAARLAYAFVRAHVESVMALALVLRRKGHHTSTREEERW